MRTILNFKRSLLSPIPPQPSNVIIRTFEPGLDNEEWLALNNKIFAHHPDQGNWAMADLENRMKELWFDAEGFFLATENFDGAGKTMVGFCWTKIHHDFTNKDPIGELYVLGVDPDAHGKGLGKALALAGLHYLAGKGLKESMLYVDADNVQGRALYSSLGFN
jgi:mycothiol synthase